MPGLMGMTGRRRNFPARWSAAAGLLAAVLGASALWSGSFQGGEQSVLPASVKKARRAGITSASNELNMSAGEVGVSTFSSASYELHSGFMRLVSAPGAVTSLTALQGPSQNQVTLRWTAPGADGAIGAAAAYLIRYRLSGPITTWTDFDSAFVFTDTITPHG